MNPRAVTVKVPATTANVGPAFDCLGIALDLWNTVTLEISDRFCVSISGEGASHLPRSQANRVYRAIEAVYERVGEPVPPLSLSCANAIPLSRGLGSSAAAAVGGVLAANGLCQRPLSQEAVLDLAVALEGHPDNVAPALLGGCQLVVQADGRWATCAVPVPPELRFVLFIPELSMPTARARAVLPQQVSRADAVFNIGRAALLLHAFATRDWERLRVATQDRLHQPARQTLFPAMPRLFQAALEAGAWGAFLSGAGSTIIALVTDREQAVAEALARAGQQAGVPGRTVAVSATPRGAQVVSGR